MPKTSDKFLRPIFFCTIFSMLSFCIFPLIADELVSDQKSKMLRTEINGLQAKLAGDRKEKVSIETELEQFDRDIARLTSQLTVLAVQIDDKVSALTQLESRKQSQQKNYLVAKQDLSIYLRASYLMGRQPQIKMLLNQEQPDRLSRMLFYNQYFSRAQLAKIKHMLEQSARLQETENLLNTEKSTLQLLKFETQDQKIKLETAREQHADVIAQLANEIKSKQAKLKKLRTDEKKLSELAKSVIAIVKNVTPKRAPGTPFAKLKGKLKWPTQGKIKARFGAARISGQQRWRGVLIETKAGEDVRAVSNGRVVFSDWLRGYGFVMIVDHGTGYMSLYGHNQHLIKHVGDLVKENEVISKAGISGGRKKPALYFEIRHKGKPINPSKWMIAKS